ncbi:hypothetical protein C8J56DRAFT_291462 [Mycena floridula]|nr:hypothetical protein C8J56DRAFT_291462 [Mycena floridula]
MPKWSNSFIPVCESEPKSLPRPATPITSSPLTPTRRRTTSIKNGQRPTKAVSRSPQQEWIYRRPKSPGSSPSNPSPVRTQVRRATISSTRPSTGYFSAPLPDNQEQACSSAPFWSGVLRTRTRAERAAKGVPLPQLMLVDPSPPRSANASPLTTCSSLTDSPTASSSSSSPDTPTSLPNLRYAEKSYRRRYQDFSFDSTSSTNTITSKLSSPSKSILTRTSSSTSKPASISSSRPSCSGRKQSFASSASSGTGKSVKFVEMPTVHYAAVGYWDFDEEQQEEETQGIDLDGMDFQPPGRISPTKRDLGQDVDIFAVGAPTWLHPETGHPWNSREDMCSTPTPESERERPAGLRKFVNIKRNQSKIPAGGSRPSISGPFALGSQPTASPVLPPPPAVQGGISLRAAPSVESFRSVKSGGARSIRSLRSLKSLPGSLKSSVSSNARGLRTWFKGRLGVGVDIGVVG